MRKTPRFLDLYHHGGQPADAIDDYVAAWHTSDSPVQLHVYLGMTWPEYQQWGRHGVLPSRAEHEVQRSDAVWSQFPGHEPELIRVHSPVRCRPVCPVHWPSGHPLVAAPLWWDPQVEIMRRLCPHGSFHPDPDDQQVRLHPELAEHDGCDDCCTARTVDGEFFEQDEPVAEILAAYARAEIAGRTGRTERPQ